MLDLQRKTDDKMLGGVAAGIAERLNVQPIYIRMLFVFFGLVTNVFGVLTYAVLWAILPSDSDHETGLDHLNDKYNEYRAKRDGQSPVQDAPRNDFPPYQG